MSLEYECPAAEQRARLSFSGVPAFWVCTRSCVRCDRERDIGPGFTKTCCVSLENTLSGSQLSLCDVEGQSRRIAVGCWEVC